MYKTPQGIPTSPAGEFAKSWLGRKNHHEESGLTVSVPRFFIFAETQHEGVIKFVPTKKIHTKQYNTRIYITCNSKKTLPKTKHLTNNHQVKPNFLTNTINMQAAAEHSLHQPPRSGIRVVSRSPWGSHSPLIMATIKGMGNCADVRAVLQECLSTKSEDHICDTAAHYFQMCINHHDDPVQK